MPREIIIGVGEQPISDITYETLILNGEQKTYINYAVSSLYTGVLNTFKITIFKSFATGCYIVFNVYSVENLGGGNYRITKQYSSNALNVPGNCDKTILSLTEQSVSVQAGWYLGITITNNSGHNVWLAQNANYYNAGYYYFYEYGNPTVWDDTLSPSSQYYIQAYGGSGWESGGVAPDACQDTGQFGGSYSGWGNITLTGFDCAVSPYQVVANIVTPWGVSEDAVVFYVGQTRQWNKSGANPAEHYSIKCTFVSCLAGGKGEFTECWWRDSDIYYVKTNGNNNNFGTTWAQAFATVTKAASVVPDGGKVYIGFGTYNGETAISPVNKGVLGIKYFPVTAGSSSGIGQVIIPL